MKKIVKLSLILLSAMCIMGNVYGAFSSNVDIIIPKTEYSKNDQFTVDIKLSNVQSDRGIIALGGTLEYDKQSLTLVKMEEKGEWSKPSYNEENGKFVMDRGSVTKSDETVFTITFKVKEGSKRNLKIALKDISISDGDATNKINFVEKDITIKEGATDTKPGTDNPDTNKVPDTNKNPNNNVSGNTSTIYDKGTLPKTGENSMISIITAVIVIAIVVLYSIIKIRAINKKEREL